MAFQQFEKVMTTVGPRRLVRGRSSFNRQTGPRVSPCSNARLCI